jgi:CheY-like chemotaxis protein
MLMSLGKNTITCLIDDDEIYLFSVKKVIEVNKLSERVLEFRNGQEAIDFFVQSSGNNQELPDVIFLDINMPVMNGWEFIEEFKKIRPQLSKDIMLYVVSSSVDKSDVDKARSFSTVNDYLIKPITATQLKNIYSAAS